MLLIVLALITQQVVSGDATRAVIPVIVDSFSEEEPISLADHAPNIAPDGSVWVVVSPIGAWDISDGKVQETTGIEWADHRAVIEATSPDANVQADITWNGGVAGLVIRHENESNWTAAWMSENNGGEITLAAAVNGKFAEISRFLVADWPLGETRRMVLRALGESLTVEIDGNVLGTVPGIGQLDASGVGMFSRGTAINSFDNFLVSLVNRPPKISPIDDVRIAPGGASTTATTIEISATDPDGNPIKLSVSGLPEFAEFTDLGGGIGRLTIAPGSTDSGGYSVGVSASDGEETSEAFFSIILEGAVASDALIVDTFTDAEGRQLSSHTSGKSPEGEGWLYSEQQSVWEIDSGRAKESTGVIWADHRAVLDAGASDIEVSADITWNSEIAGLVVRYDNESNWIMAWYNPAADGQIIVASIAHGKFAEATRFEAPGWGAGDSRTMKVTALGEEISVTLDGEFLGSVIILGQFDGTEVGLFSRSTAEEPNLFDNFEAATPNRGPELRRLKDTRVIEGESAEITVSASDADGDPVKLAIVGLPGFGTFADNGDGTGVIVLKPAAGDAGIFELTVTATDGETDVERTLTVIVGTPISADVTVLDTFSDVDGNVLSSHIADASPGGAEWQEVSMIGSWEISAGAISETTMFDWTDHRAVIETGLTDIHIEVDIEWNGGAAGLVFRYENESNWDAVWVEGADATELVVGSMTNGQLTEVARSTYAGWSPGSAHNLAMDVTGSAVTVTIDGDSAIDATLAGEPAGTEAGLFARTANEIKFDDFLVRSP